MPEKMAWGSTPFHKWRTEEIVQVIPNLALFIRETKEELRDRKLSKEERRKKDRLLRFYNSEIKAATKVLEQRGYYK